MAGWFSRVIPGNAPAEAEPVTFALTCRCGRVVTGVRGSRMHVAVCSECRHQLCVLPVSPYPRPKASAQQKKAAKPKISRELPDSEESRTPPPVSKRSSRSPIGSKQKPASKKVVASISKRPDRSEQPPRDVSYTAPRSPLVTPLRLVAFGMIGVVGLAGWWVAHRRAVAQAVIVFAEAAKMGQAALAGSDFETADRQFQRAVKALNLLHRDDREARQVRQQAREATAAHGLALNSLFELASEARSARKLSAANWQQSIKQSYQGRWFLLETNGLQFTTGASPQWRFSVPLIPGSEPLQISGDLSKWSRVFGEKPPSNVILAGQLEEVRPLGDGKGPGLEIVLRQDTLCLWTSPGVYAALGGALDDGSQMTLTSQARMLELTE